MTHIEPIDTITPSADEVLYYISQTRLKINEVINVLNSLTEKKLPVECEEEKKIPHAHCKCMNLDGQCPNYHFATCPICKPEKTAESEWKSKVRKLWERTNSSDDWINLINDILSSHTEQKKEELIEKINKLIERPIAKTVPMLLKSDVLHLIKEL